MARKTPGIEDVADIPWWVGCVLAVVSAALIGVGLNRLVEGENQIVSHVARNATFLTYVIPGLFLMASGASALRSWRRGELFGRRRYGAEVRRLGWGEIEACVHEKFCLEGYAVERRDGEDPDGGIDLVLRKEGSIGIVRCRHWKDQKAGVNLLRELIGEMKGERFSWCGYVTSGDYTSEARRFGERAEVRMIDGYDLKMWIEEIQSSGEVRPSEETKTGTQSGIWVAEGKEWGGSVS